MRLLLLAIFLGTAAAAESDAAPVQTPPGEICQLIDQAKKLGSLTADSDAGKLARKVIVRPMVDSGFVSSLEPTKDGKHAAWVTLRFRALDFQAKRDFASALCPFVKDITGGSADSLVLLDGNTGKVYATYDAKADDLDMK